MQEKKEQKLFIFHGNVFQMTIILPGQSKSHNFLQSITLATIIGYCQSLDSYLKHELGHTPGTRVGPGGCDRTLAVKGRTKNKKLQDAIQGRRVSTFSHILLHSA